MINWNFSLRLMAAYFIILLIVFGNGIAQTNSEDFNSRALNNVIELAIEALSDSSVSIAVCKVPVVPQYSTFEIKDKEKAKNFFRIFTDLGSTQIEIIDKLRVNVDMDSLIFLNRAAAVTREGYKAHLPSIVPTRGSEWILLLDSPFRESGDFHASVLKEYAKLVDRAVLNSNNFFFPYNLGAGGLCVYYPEDAKYRPQFIYSEGLVDDFKTIIRLQKNPSLLSASADSYEAYYNSLKDDLGKRVFERLFGNADQD